MVHSCNLGVSIEKQQLLKPGIYSNEQDKSMLHYFLCPKFYVGFNLLKMNVRRFPLPVDYVSTEMTLLQENATLKPETLI
jgi:hypothetical protein